MDLDDVVTALNNLTAAIRRSSDDDRARQDELLEAVKAQAGSIVSIEMNTGNLVQMEQTLRDCEQHLRDLAERLAPAPDYD